MAEIRTKWLASLSNGETIIEGSSPCEEIAGEPSPWLKLCAYLKEKNILVTSLRVQVSKPGEATRTYNLPSTNRTPMGNHEKWAAIYPIIPIGFNYFRIVTAEVFSNKPSKRHIQIRAEYEDFFVSLMVDENDGNESWVVVHKKGR